MQLTEEILEQGISRNGGWSNAQLRVLGVKIPLRSGWKKRIIGKFFEEIEIKRFLELKDAHLPDEDYSSEHFRCPHCNKQIYVFGKSR